MTVSYKGKTIVLTPDQALASVAGRLVSLPAPPSRNGPALAGAGRVHQPRARLIYDARLDLRKPSRLLVIGDLRVPRITARYEPLGAARAADHRRDAARHQHRHSGRRPSHRSSSTPTRSTRRIRRSRRPGRKASSRRSASPTRRRSRRSRAALRRIPRVPQPVDRPLRLVIDLLAPGRRRHAGAATSRRRSRAPPPPDLPPRSGSRRRRPSAPSPSIRDTAATTRA